MKNKCARCEDWKKQGLSDKCPDCESILPASPDRKIWKELELIERWNSVLDDQPGGFNVPDMMAAYHEGLNDAHPQAPSEQKELEDLRGENLELLSRLSTPSPATVKMRDAVQMVLDFGFRFVEIEGEFVNTLEQLEKSLAAFDQERAGEK